MHPTRLLAALLLGSLVTLSLGGYLTLDEAHRLKYERNQPFGVLVRLTQELDSESAFLDAAAALGSSGRQSEAHSLWTAFTNRDSLPRAQRRGVVQQVRSLIALHAHKQLLALIPDELQPAAANWQSFWISNAVFFPQASRAFVDWLVQAENVHSVRPADAVAATVEPFHTVQQDETPADQTRAIEWNIALIRADAAWNITRGENIVVAVIDTGTRYTHQALVANYRGNLGNNRFDHDYNWWDPKEFANDDWWCNPGLPCNNQPRPECCADYPFDVIGHGSHVTGSAVGSATYGIGVAPGAKWIAAKGCRDGQCLNYGLITSAEWTLCPTKRDGSAPDCSRGADIVSNSWGGSQTDSFYLDYVRAWRDAGIIPVFANGNSGPRCSTTGAPGNYVQTIGVGCTNKADALSRFSSRGPGPNQAGYANMKPDISAPGEDIRSSYGNGDSTYSVSSGTSMACPHISGVAALVLSVNPSLTYEQVYEAMSSTAVRRLGVPAGNVATCDGLGYETFPNYFYGYGRVDAFAAVQYALSLKK